MRCNRMISCSTRTQDPYVLKPTQLSNVCDQSTQAVFSRPKSLCIRTCANDQNLLRNIREHSKHGKVIHVSSSPSAHALVAPYYLRDPLTAAYVTLKLPSRNVKGRLRDDPYPHGSKKRLKDVLMGPVTTVRDPVTGAPWGIRGPLKPSGRV
jgi:hypothetical protein